MASHIYREGNRKADWLAGEGKFTPNVTTLIFVSSAQRNMRESYRRIMKWELYFAMSVV